MTLRRVQKEAVALSEEVEDLQKKKTALSASINDYKSICERLTAELRLASGVSESGTVNTSNVLDG